MGANDRRRVPDQDVGAEPKERLFTTLPDQAFAEAYGFLRKKTGLPDSEILRQAIIRLHREVKGRGALLVEVLPEAGRA